MHIVGLILLGLAIRALFSRGDGVRSSSMRLPVIWFLLLFASTIFALLAVWVVGRVDFVPVLVACLLAMFPEWFLMPVFIRLGWVNAASWAAWTSPLFVGHDRLGNVTAAMALAWLYGGCDAEAAEMIEGRLRTDILNPIRGGGALAAGLLAWGRGDLVQARTLMALVHYFPARVTTPWVRRRACRWLLAEAAQRGDWREVHFIARRHRADGVARVLKSIARRELGERVPRWKLDVVWLTSFNWVSTWPIYSMARKRDPEPEPTTTIDPAVSVAEVTAL
ncbi:MAG: hypothetical protein AAF658_15370, partial [Myxococcota bacterium]